MNTYTASVGLFPVRAALACGGLLRSSSQGLGCGFYEKEIRRAHLTFMVLRDLSERAHATALFAPTVAFVVNQPRAHKPLVIKEKHRRHHRTSNPFCPHRPKLSSICPIEPVTGVIYIFLIILSLFYGRLYNLL